MRLHVPVLHVPAGAVAPPESAQAVARLWQVQLQPASLCCPWHMAGRQGTAAGPACCGRPLAASAGGCLAPAAAWSGCWKAQPAPLLSCQGREGGRCRTCRSGSCCTCSTCHRECQPAAPPQQSASTVVLQTALFMCRQQQTWFRSATGLALWQQQRR